MTADEQEAVAREAAKNKKATLEAAEKAAARTQAWMWFAAIFVVSAILSAVLNGSNDVKFKDSASVLAFIAVLAVSIERGIEMVWTFLNGKKGFGGWWPMSMVAEHASKIETQLNLLLEEPFKKATEALASAKNATGVSTKVLNDIEAQLVELPQFLARLQARADKLETLAPGSTRVAFASDAAADAQAFLSRAAENIKLLSVVPVKLPLDQQSEEEKARLGETSKGLLELSSQLKGGVDTISDAVNFATGVVASFQDNPARRTASLMLGVSAGMVASGATGVNMFTAVLEQETGRLLSGTLGVLATGIVIGLGSNPTHEVIKALQNYKKSRQPQTAAAVTVETSQIGNTEESSVNYQLSENMYLVRNLTGASWTREIESDASTTVRRKRAIMIRTTD